MRMEDIDPIRSKPEYAAAIMRDLQWLGLNWDGESYVQSARLGVYEQTIAAFAAQGLVYPCYCTRKELRELASAPHMAANDGGAGDLGAPYPGACRNLTAKERAEFEAQGRKPCIRLRYPEQNLEINDLVLGNCVFNGRESGGDFALRRSDGVFAYQLAVSVDDAAMGVTQVVRGKDILASTPRQIYLLQLLGGAIPEYAHVPLILDQEGERLAKRHNSLRLTTLRENGVAADAVIGWLAHLAGLQDNAKAAKASEFLSAFSFSRLPKENIFLRGENLPAFIS